MNNQKCAFLKLAFLSGCFEIKLKVGTARKSRFEVENCQSYRAGSDAGPHLLQ